MRLPTLRIGHLFQIAVIGGQQHLAAYRSNGLDDFANRYIHRLDRCNRRRQDAGVTDHVGIGDVADDQIVTLPANVIDQLRG